MIYKRQPSIFLSYAREDEDIVTDLYYRLIAYGYKVWMDKFNIVGGEQWERSIWRGVKSSDFFIACLSPQSVYKRGFVQREMKYALRIWDEKLEDDIYLIPVMIEKSEIPERAGQFQVIKFFEDDGWYKLVQAVDTGMRRLFEPRTVSWSKGLITVRRKQLHEPVSEEHPYTITVDYPRFEGADTQTLEEINAIMLAGGYSRVQEARRMCDGTPLPILTDIEGNSFEIGPSYFVTTYDLLLLTESILSVKFNESYYGAGAAHSNQLTSVENYRLNPMMPITLADLFRYDSGYVEELSRICRHELMQQQKDAYRQDSRDALGPLGQEVSPDSSEISHMSMVDTWIAEGAAPDETNFKTFNLTERGLLISFDPYTVGPYAWGTRHVLIPYADVTHLIDPEGPIHLVQSTEK